MTMTDNQLQDGRVVGIAGPVIDVEPEPWEGDEDATFLHESREGGDAQPPRSAGDVVRGDGSAEAR